MRLYAEQILPQKKIREELKEYIDKYITDTDTIEEMIESLEDEELKKFENEELKNIKNFVVNSVKIQKNKYHDNSYTREEAKIDKKQQKLLTKAQQKKIKEKQSRQMKRKQDKLEQLYQGNLIQAKLKQLKKSINNLSINELMSFTI